MRSRDPGRHLSKLSAEARAELFALLSGADGARSAAIGGLYSSAETRSLADVLIDLESDPVMRLEVLRLLRDSLDPSGP